MPKLRGLSASGYSNGSDHLGVFADERDMERRAAEIVQNEVPDIAISLSCELGQFGLLPRENSTIINAAFPNLSEPCGAGLPSRPAGTCLNVPLFISQNDGTLMRADDVQRYPVLTFASGPTNSMRGAVYLAGIQDAMVVDIGGTTSDIGMLRNGFPRQSTNFVDVGGVKTNFRMPDVLAVGLGGGSLVRDEGRLVGPDSVGYELTSRAQCFGGDTLTATDIAVAEGGPMSETDRWFAQTRQPLTPPAHRCAYCWIGMSSA